MLAGCSLAPEVNASAVQRREPFPRRWMELKNQAAFSCINAIQASASINYSISVILGLYLYIVFIRVLARKLHGAYQYSIHREKASKKYTPRKSL